MFCVISPFFKEICREDPPYDFRDVPTPLPPRWIVPVPASIRLNEPQWLRDIYDPIEKVEYELRNTRDFGQVYIRASNRSFKEILARDPFSFLREEKAVL